MTIDDLKTMDKTDLMYAFDDLGDEILALVEAVESHRKFFPNDPWMFKELDAFNAKLESLRP